MGFPLRSNIFKYGTHEQKYFSRFPVQVAVLFSPKDEDFVEAFQNLFLTLDTLTGDDVAFFAVLDPPQNWLEEAQKRRWWQEYTRRIGRVGFSMDNRVLVKEIARLFGIGWGELPQIVVSPDLWTGEYIKIPTSPFHIERQLAILTRLVHELGEPNIDHIAESLSETFGTEPSYHPPDDALRYRFSRVYGVLDIAENVEGSERIEQFSKYLDEELRQIDATIRRIRWGGNNRQQQRGEREIDEFVSDTAVESIIEDASGRLVAPATVAMRIFQQFQDNRGLELTDQLEEESLVMVETALTNGNFLENLQNGSLRGMAPLRLGTGGRHSARWQPFEIDFTPGVQGIWKSFELEINFSLIQAARASILIRMPEFFALYDGGLPDKKRSRIPIGKNTYRDINQRDSRASDSRRHRFLTIGDALAVIQKMSTEPDYQNVIFRCLGHSFPSDFFGIWKQIHKIRNRGSHIEPLRYEDYKAILEDALSKDTLDPLIRIKRKLSSRP